ncbi:YlxR family protein [Desulfoglaeba alkanexedens]|uniref:YlxR family protein n=1 Tax=Desulfoglaeba alkanexedens TaxID=361111 RepID=UPI0014777DCA
MICRTRRPKTALIRLALDSGGLVTVDPGQRAPGRGAYTCPSCLPELRFDRRIQRAFRQRAQGFHSSLDALLRGDANDSIATRA